MNKRIIVFGFFLLGIFQNVFSQCDSIGINPTAPNPGSGSGITRVVFAGIDHSTPLEEGYTFEGDSGAQEANLYIDTLGAELTVEYSSSCFMNGMYLAVFIDWNNDGDFLDIWEQVTGSNLFGLTSWNVPIDIPNTAVIGKIRMCVMLSNWCTTNNISSPCMDIVDGDVEDYYLNINASQRVGQSINDCMLAGSINNPILRIKTYPWSTGLTVNNITFNT